jgi:hypothetical protein
MSEERDRLTSQYVQPDNVQLNLGDLFVIPGSGTKGLLHYGVKRDNQVQVAFTCCPKITFPKIPKHSSEVCGRCHTQFLVIMAHFWGVFPGNKKYQMRLKLLKWFSVYICLSLCNGARISNELSSFKEMQAMLRVIEETLFGIGDKTDNADNVDEHNIIKLPSNKRLCFIPKSLPPYDYSSKEPEREPVFNFSEGFEVACEAVFDFIKEEGYHKINELCNQY